MARSIITKKAFAWLLNHDDPSIRFRVRRDLLDERPPSGWQDEIIDGPTARRIFKKMHPDGYWLHRGIGAGIDYAMSESTHFVLSYLAELGLDRKDKRIDLAANRYLDLKSKEKWLTAPDHLTGQSCLYAHNIRTFTLLGYGKDPRLKERIRTLQAELRFDGGYLCRRPAFTDATKSCIRGTLKALMAYAETPSLWNKPSCVSTAEYFLSRRVFFRKDRPGERIRGGMAVSFPFTIDCSLLEPLYALSKMGHGRDKTLNEAWKDLKRRDDGDGRIILDRDPPSIFKAGKKGEPSPWATFYAYLALKYRDAVDFTAYHPKTTGRPPQPRQERS